MMLDRRKLELAALAAFEAYWMEVGGVAVNGDELPHWPGLKEPIRAAWRMAADAAVMVATGSTPPLPSHWRPLGPGAYVAPLGTEPPRAEPAGDEAVAQSREVDVEAGPDDER